MRCFFAQVRDRIFRDADATDGFSGTHAAADRSGSARVFELSGWLEPDRIYRAVSGWNDVSGVPRGVRSGLINGVRIRNT